MKSCCENCCNKGCMSKVSIFNNIDKENLEDLINKMDHKKYNKGDVIFNEGDENDTLYFVSSGKIKLYKYTKDGKEQILHILSEGDFFGELNLLKESTSLNSSKAITNCSVCTLSSKEFREVIIEKAGLALNIIEALTERLRETENLAQTLASNDVDSRIAYLLYSLSERYGQKNDDNIIELDLPVSREDMANFTGVTRETISRKLKKLEDDGVIKLIGTKKMKILDEEILKDYM